jgi:hypothetical protein
MSGTADYRRYLLEARSRAQRLGAESVQRIVTAFNQAIADLTRDVATGRITVARGVELKRQVTTTLAALEREIAGATARGVQLTVDGVLASHRAALMAIEKESKVVGIAKQLDMLNVRALAVLGAREKNAAAFRTLMNRHIEDAAPALDRMIESAVARGVSSRALTTDVARLLGGAEIEYGAYEVERSATTGLRSVFSDAKMIAVSETNNALREANARALATGRVVDVVQWQLSGNHGDQFDECDVLAQSDWFGAGPGWFDVRQWPSAPHPFCGCYQGAVQLRPIAEWRQPRGEVPALRDDVSLFRSSAWTARAESRIHRNAMGAVRQAVAHPVAA